MYRSGAILFVALLLLITAMGCDDDPITVSHPKYSALSDSSFAVADSSVLVVNNFAGNVDVLPGAPGVVQVTVTKWARQEGDLGEIGVEMIEMQNGVSITTANPLELTSVSVDLEITVPPDTRPDLKIAAGEMKYEGRAEGQCLFMVAAGSIALQLPADVNVEVYLSVAAGSIQIDFPVDGRVSERVVEGTIGTGVEGYVEAHVASGNISVTRQSGF